MPIGYQKELDVNIQSQTEPPFRYFMHRELNKTITLTSPIEVGDDEINISAGHGFTGAADEIITVWGPVYYLQSRVVDVTDNVITIENKSAHDFTILSSSVIRGNINLAVNGESSPIDFAFDMNGSQIPIDISTMTISMLSAAVPDDGKFGGAAALALEEGMTLRREGGLTYNFGNYTKNQDFFEAGAILSYPDKAPAGTNATNIVFNLINIYTKEVRFIPTNNDKLLGQIRGDLTDNTSIHIILHGSYTTGE